MVLEKRDGLIVSSNEKSREGLRSLADREEERMKVEKGRFSLIVGGEGLLW